MIWAIGTLIICGLWVARANGLATPWWVWVAAVMMIVIGMSKER